jgi:serine protease inhibitor
MELIFKIIIHVLFFLSLQARITEVFSKQANFSRLTNDKNVSLSSVLSNTTVEICEDGRMFAPLVPGTIIIIF